MNPENGKVDRPVTAIGALTIDGPDAGELARFYVAALGASDDGERGGVHFAHLPHLALCFRSVDDYTPPAWGDTAGGPMHMHVELYVDDLHTAHRQLTELGARTPKHQPEWDTDLIVLLDPAGHPFCIFERPTTAQ